MRFLSNALRVVPAVLLLLLALTTAGAAQAAEEASFSVQPASTQSTNAAYFVYDAELGQVIHDEVLVTNTGDAPGTARLYALDGMTGPTGGIVFPDADAPRSQVGAWVQLDETEVTLGPGESRTVGFTVTVPRELRAGHHVGGIAAQGTAVNEGSGQFQVNVQTRVVTAVQVNLPGPAVEHVTIDGVTPSVQGSKQTLVLGLRNDGNQMVKPQGTVTIADGEGRELHSIPLQVHTFLPDTAIEYPLMIPGEALAAGDYRVVVDLQYGAQGAARYEGAFTIPEAQAAQVDGATPGEQSATVTAPAEQGLSIWMIVAVAGAGLLAGLLLAGGGLLIWRRRAAVRRSEAPAAGQGSGMSTIRPFVPASRVSTARTQQPNGDD